MNSPIVMGGMVMDLRGRPENRLQMYTSNPGSLQQIPGGVGRNIAENLIRLGWSPLLISTVGGDLTGDTLLHHAAGLGMDTRGLVQISGERTAVYLAVLNEFGDLHTAIADMAIFQHLTPERVLAFADEIAAAPLVIMDTNLPRATLELVANFCQEKQVPLLVEPVSMEKSRKLLGLMDKITYLTPNIDELTALTEMPISSEDELTQAAEVLIGAGLKNLVVTLGKDGAVMFTKDGGQRLPAFPASVVDVTGAGDSFVAGMAHGILCGKDIETALRYGMAVGKFTVETLETVSSDLSRHKLDRFLMEVEK